MPATGEPTSRELRSHCIVLCGALRASSVLGSDALAPAAMLTVPARAALSRAARRHARRHARRRVPGPSRAATREESDAECDRAVLAAKHYCALLLSEHVVATSGGEDVGGSDFRKRLFERFVLTGVCSREESLDGYDERRAERVIASVVGAVSEHCARSWERFNPTMRNDARGRGGALPAEWVRRTRRSARELLVMKQGAAACTCTRCGVSRSRWCVRPSLPLARAPFSFSLSLCLSFSFSRSFVLSFFLSFFLLHTYITRHIDTPHTHTNRGVTPYSSCALGAAQDSSAPPSRPYYVVGASPTRASSAALSGALPMRARQRATSDVRTMFDEVLAMLHTSLNWSAEHGDAHVDACRFRALRDAMRLSDLRSRAECLFVFARESAFLTEDGAYDADASAPSEEEVCALLEQARACLEEGQARTAAAPASAAAREEKEREAAYE